MELAFEGHVDLQRIIESDDLFRGIPCGEKLTSNERLNCLGLDLVFDNVAHAQIRDGDMDLTNVGVHGSDALDRRAEVLDGIGSGSRDAAIGLVHANEGDVDFVVAGGIGEDELSPGLHRLRALDTDSSVLRFVIGAIILKNKRSAHLLDD